MVAALLVPRGSALFPGGELPPWRELWVTAGGPQLYRAALDSLDGGWTLDAALPHGLPSSGLRAELGPEPLGGELPLPPDLAPGGAGTPGGPDIPDVPGSQSSRGSRGSRDIPKSPGSAGSGSAVRPGEPGGTGEGEAQLPRPPRGPAVELPDRVRPPGRPGPGQEQPVQVAVYHTHISETYVGPDGDLREAHRYGTEATGIVAAGQALVEALAQEGIRALHDTTIHDYPSVARAYQASLATGLDLLARHPSIQVVIDLHRDGIQLGQPTALYRGEPAARILLVVTTGGDGLPHPGWETNLAWARRLHAALEEVAPGLSRGVYVQKRWRYNEHIHPRALVVEIGTYTNTVTEARRAARALAKALAVAMAAEGLFTSPPEVLGR